jgi:Domain of unknown function DUF29
MSRPLNATAYEQDFVTWLEEQARHLRRGEIDALDPENIAEELEGMARSDRREIRNRLTVLLAHLLKHQLQPRRRSSSWLGTIGEQRSRTRTVIDDSPSLRGYPASVIGQCYAEARSRTALETRLHDHVFPEDCPFGIDEVLDPSWLPQDAPE